MLIFYSNSKVSDTFDFRPHAGESGSDKHLVASFLTAKHINHGINLTMNMPLQYL